MKVFFTLDSLCEENIEQHCPVGEVYKEGIMAGHSIWVGSGGCMDCRHCFGKHEERSSSLLPILPHSKIQDGNEFALVPVRYVLCAGCIKNPTRWTKVRLLWWHKVVRPVGKWWNEMQLNHKWLRKSWLGWQ